VADSLLSRLKHEQWDREWDDGAHCIPPLAHEHPARVIPALYPNVCPQCLGTTYFMRGFGGVLLKCVWCDGGEVDPWTPELSKTRQSEEG
jgi:hypothetical protein